MFGYIKAYKPELKIKEYELYRGVYCSLCRELGKSFSIFARFTLSYDFVFVALLSMSLNGDCPEFKKGRCAFNPMAKCNYLQNGDGSLKLSANAAVILLYYKLLDSIKDEWIFKKMLCYAAYPFAAAARKKASKSFPEIDKLASEFISYQSKVEEDENASVDKAADPTAKLLESLCSLLSSNEKDKQYLKRFGYCLGRWVYLIDAADDLEDDIKSGNFNPFKLYNCTMDVKKYADDVLTLSAGEAHKAFTQLDIKRFKSILDNILLMGLESEQDRVLGN